MTFFQTDFPEDDELRLVLERTVEADAVKIWAPAYHFLICDRRGVRMGRCSLRIGYSEGLYYGGHVGYGIDEPFRGHRYAAKACRLLFSLARKHDMPYLYVTCNPRNLPSRKTCEALNGELLEIAELPEDHDMRAKGETEVCVFRFRLLPDGWAGKTERLRYRLPEKSDRTLLGAYVREHLDRGERGVSASLGLASSDYDEWVRRILTNACAGSAAWGRSLLYLCFDADRLVGLLNVRYELPARLTGVIGDVGYGVRPSERRRGYATEMLRHALSVCAEKGMDRAVLGCFRDNPASAATIRKNGGVLIAENDNYQKGRMSEYYAIRLRAGGQAVPSAERGRAPDPTDI